MKSLHAPCCVLALGLLLTACGGGGGGGGGGGDTMPPPVVETPSGCGEGASLLACYAGSYEPRNVYLGAEPAWSQLIVGADGGASFQGEEALSFAAADIVDVADRRASDGSIVVRVDGGREYRFVVGSDGTLYDVEYDNSVARAGITVADLPAWRQSASLSHGIKGTVAGRNYAIYVDPDAAEASYADARGLHIAAFEADGATGWRLHIDGFAAGDFPRSYPCRAQPSATTSLEFVAPGLALSGATPGRCRIDISYIEYLTPNDPRTPIDYIDGRFVAELQGETPSTPVRVVDGLFRFDAN